MATKTTKKTAKKAVKKAAGKSPANAKKKVAKKPVRIVAKKKVSKPAVKSKAKTNGSAKAPAPKVTLVNAYMNFNGNCEAAFQFYRTAFGGDFGYIGRFKEMPPIEGKPVPPGDGNKIMHISLKISEETVLMGSDVIVGMGAPYIAGNNFSMSINAKSKTEADRFFRVLSGGGTIIMPMANTFWGSYFGMFTDRFGINWMINFDTNPQG